MKRPSRPTNAVFLDSNDFAAVLSLLLPKPMSRDAVFWALAQFVSVMLSSHANPEHVLRALQTSADAKVEDMILHEHPDDEMPRGTA